MDIVAFDEGNHLKVDDVDISDTGEFVLFFLD